MSPVGLKKRRSLLLGLALLCGGASCDAKRAVVRPSDSPLKVQGSSPAQLQPQPRGVKVSVKTPTTPSHGGVASDAPRVTYRGTFPKKRKVGFHAAHLKVAGVAREVTVYFPAKVAAKPALIIACHGTGGNAEDGVWDIAANEAADATGAIVVSLQARHMRRGDWDNHEAGQVFFETSPNLAVAKNNDLQLVLASIVEAKRAYGVDPKRVYIGGFSNGAFFAQFAALALPQVIAGFASSAGGLVRCPKTGSCGFRGKALTCAALRREPGYCRCTGRGKPAPLVARGGPKPAAYLAHSIRDDTVSSFYTCELAARLRDLGHPVKVSLRRQGDHGSPPHFMVSALTFLAKYPLK